jgi:DMSO/TMAO reductase YedYZ molybdopterin-dependent catalytic subunit
VVILDVYKQGPAIRLIARMKEAYIAAKERWARKRAGQERPPARSQDRLPPGQHLVHNFPVLDLGLQPEVALDRWELKIHGHVEHAVTLRWPEFLALPQFKDVGLRGLPQAERTR